MPGFTEFLSRLGRPMTYYPSMATVIGLKESIFLCQLIYWTPYAKNAKGEGWIYKSVDEMEKETALSYKEQIRLRANLVRQELLDEKYDRTEHRLYFRVNLKAVDVAMKALGEELASGHRRNINGGVHTLTVKQWKRTFEIFGKACGYCGVLNPATKDHFIPLELGGSTANGNMVPCCSNCNSSKGAKHPVEWCSAEQFSRVSALLYKLTIVPDQKEDTFGNQPSSKKSFTVLPKVSSYKEAEITTEITHKNQIQEIPKKSEKLKAREELERRQNYTEARRRGLRDFTKRPIEPWEEPLTESEMRRMNRGA